MTGLDKIEREKERGRERENERKERLAPCLPPSPSPLPKPEQYGPHPWCSHTCSPLTHPPPKQHRLSKIVFIFIVFDLVRFFCVFFFKWELDLVCQLCFSGNGFK